jgi:hypothetical protein
VEFFKTDSKIKTNVSAKLLYWQAPAFKYACTCAFEIRISPVNPGRAMALNGAPIVFHESMRCFVNTQ